MTILEVLIQSLRKAGTFNKDVQAAPVCILWPDKERQWETVMPILRTFLPQLLTLGDYNLAKKTGPAIWLKCMISRTLPEADWPEEIVPILYLPGVGRSDLRAIESCPKELQPLAELQYRGAFWSQKNGKDWTLFGFLKSSEGGAGLDVAQDEKTLQALRMAFPLVLNASLPDLQGRRLESQDFNHLLTPDPVRDLLRWLDNPMAAKSLWTDEEWSAFTAVCQTELKFNPVTDGEISAAELLVQGKGKWGEVWKRYTEAPERYPGLPDLLRRTKEPIDLFSDKEKWPQINDREEKNLRQDLSKLLKHPPHEARAKVVSFEKQHGKRRAWVWTRLGQAPLARAMEYLAEIASLTEKSLTGDTIDELSRSYKVSGWKVDGAVLKALAEVTKGDDVPAVHTAIRSIYLPWLEETAIRFQTIIAKQGYKVSAKGNLEPLSYDKGEPIFFVDGLRYDLAQRLKEMAESKGCTVEITSRWAGAPTVTATTKPAVSPVSGSLAGTVQSVEFLPCTSDTGKPLSPNGFRKMLEDAEWQVLSAGDTGNPEGQAWCEFGNLDQYGHQHGWKLARYIREHLSEVTDLMEKLFDAGWKRIHVVTDHGWLLLPGGLPKAELAKCLTETRWGRCALLKESAIVDSLVVPWYWSNDINIAVPPGICCYMAGREYDHGGLTLQECLTPVLTVSRIGASDGKASIVEHVWRGLRCKVKVKSDMIGLKVDIRTKAGDPGSSVVSGGKLLDVEGSASLIVENDTVIGVAAFVVVIGREDKILAKDATTIGGG